MIEQVSYGNPLPFLPSSCPISQAEALLASKLRLQEGLHRTEEQLGQLGPLLKRMGATLQQMEEALQQQQQQQVQQPQQPQAEGQALMLQLQQQVAAFRQGMEEQRAKQAELLREQAELGQCAERMQQQQQQQQGAVGGGAQAGPSKNLGGGGGGVTAQQQREAGSASGEPAGPSGQGRGAASSSSTLMATSPPQRRIVPTPTGRAAASAYSAALRDGAVSASARPQGGVTPTVTPVLVLREDPSHTDVAPVLAVPPPGFRDGPARPAPRSLMRMTLAQRRTGNVAAVKLIGIEDRMDEWGDEHSHPNVDCQFVAFMGCVMELPPRVYLQG